MPFKGVDENVTFHQIVIDWIRCGLDQIHVLPADCLLYRYRDFAVFKIGNVEFPNSIPNSLQTPSANGLFALPKKPSFPLETSLPPIFWFVFPQCSHIEAFASPNPRFVLDRFSRS